MEGYIDIHSHILPGIDDGAKNFETSMEMLKTAEKSGIKSIILTPHHKPMRREGMDIYELINGIGASDDHRKMTGGVDKWSARRNEAGKRIGKSRNCRIR